MDRGHASWTCITAGPTDAEGFADVRLVLSCATDAHFNKVTELKPDVILIELGVPKVKRRDWTQANIELLGFLGSLFDLKEDQVRMESEADRTKRVILSGLRLEKREVIWAFQKVVGQRHEAHFATDNMTAARIAASKEGQKRKDELEEFKSLKEEARSTLAPVRVMGMAELGAKKALPSVLKVKRKTMDTPGVEPSSPAKQAAVVIDPSDAKELAEGQASGNGASEKLQGLTKKIQSLQQTMQAQGGLSEPSAAAGGLGGLASYDSDEESDEEDEVAGKLPQPNL
jgi:hypothetical protein